MGPAPEPEQPCGPTRRRPRFFATGFGHLLDGGDPNWDFRGRVGGWGTKIPVNPSAGAEGGGCPAEPGTATTQQPHPPRVPSGPSHPLPCRRCSHQPRRPVRCLRPYAPRAVPHDPLLGPPAPPCPSSHIYRKPHCAPCTNPCAAPSVCPAARLQDPPFPAVTHPVEPSRLWGGIEAPYPTGAFPHPYGRATGLRPVRRQVLTTRYLDPWAPTSPGTYPPRYLPKGAKHLSGWAPGVGRGWLGHAQCRAALVPTSPRLPQLVLV